MKTIVVRQPNDLEKLSASRRLLPILWFDHIAFNLQNVSRHQQMGWERKLNVYVKRCGCTSGAIVMLLVLGLTIYYTIFIAESHSILSTVFSIILGFFTALLTGLLAKLITLIVSALQFKTMTRKIICSLLIH